MWAYGFVYYRIGKEVAKRCNASYHCRSYLQPTLDVYTTDVADNQWRDFRSSLPLLIGAAALISVLHFVLHKVYPHREVRRGLSISCCFHFIVGMIFIVIQHSYHAAVIIAILVVNYVVMQCLRSSHTITIYTWLYALGIVALKESHRMHWDALYVLFDRSLSGMYSWRFPANFLLLRIVSYNIDCARSASPSSSDYNFISYVSYCLYAPLYVAGPIISYDDYIAQSRAALRQKSTSCRHLICSVSNDS